MIIGKCIETKDKMKYTFGKDGYLRFDEDPDGNKVTYEYEPNSTQNYIPYITDPTGAKIEFVYKNDAALSRITAIKDTSGRLIQYMYDNAGNLSTITYPDGEKTTFTYDSGHRLLSVTNPEGYSISYQYTNDFRVPRISRITEKGSENQLGQEMKISYTNGNITTFEEPNWMEILNRLLIIRRQSIILIIWDARLMCWKMMDMPTVTVITHQE